jgi:hypothetical protein
VSCTWYHALLWLNTFTVSQTESSERLHDEGLEVVGWYHSHPTFFPNPSLQDLDTQRHMQDWFAKTASAPLVGFILSPYCPTSRTLASDYRYVSHFLLYTIFFTLFSITFFSVSCWLQVLTKLIRGNYYMCIKSAVTSEACFIVWKLHLLTLLFPKVCHYQEFLVTTFDEILCWKPTSRCWV